MNSNVVHGVNPATKLRQAAFKDSDAAKCLAGSGMYDCGFNVFWLKLTHLSQPGVPLAERSISIIKESRFKTPKPETFVCHVPDPSHSLGGTKGNWEMLCPEEPLHAMILRIAERIEDPEADEEELHEWRDCCLRCTAIIEVQKTVEDRYWKSINLREATVADFEALSRDVLQRILELVSYRDLLKTHGNREISNSELAKRFQERVAQVDSKFSERVTNSFVDMAMKVHNRLLSPQIIELIMKACGAVASCRILCCKLLHWCWKVPKLVLESTSKLGAGKYQGAGKYYQSWCCKVPKLVLQSTKVGAGK